MLIINRIGAIDIGSNSIKLLISDIINYNGKVVNKKYIHTRMPLRLGDDTFLLGYISDTKQEKLVKILRTFKYFLEINDTENYRVCATSAIREASNCQELVDYISDAAGIKIDVIDQQEEAHLLFLNNINEEYNPEALYVTVDVGGGSTEIVLSKRNRLIDYQSFLLGTIRELPKEYEKKEWEALRIWLEEKIKNEKEISLIGSGGNINKINSLYKKKGKMKRSDLNDYYKRLANLDYEERVVKMELGLNRAAVLLPALKIYLNIMKFIKAETIHIPVIGIADGIIKYLYLA